MIPVYPDAHDRLDLLTITDVAQVMGYTIAKNGRCRQIERITSEKYCAEKGIRPLPYYFGGSRMVFDKKEFLTFLQQFKNRKWTTAE